MSEEAAPTPADTITIERAALRLGVSVASTYRAARRGDLPVIRIGSRWLVLRGPFEALLRSGRLRDADDR